MERDKRRSKEEEEELDRKIALIREKNQKIEQRTKEIEADRVNNTDQAPKKSPKIPSASSQPAKGGKNREWDHGKTPADTWRENVPSMDLNNRLAGRGGDGTRGGQRGRGGGQRQRNAPEQSKGGRLEGRVTLSHESADGHRGGAVRGGGRNRGGRGGGRTYEREVQNKGGELQISIKNIEPGERGGERRRDSRNSAEKKEKGGDKQGNRPQNEQNKKKRHESDNYVVRSIVGKLVDRVDRMGKAEKRREARETEKEGDRETEKEGARETEREGARETEKEGATPEPEIRTEQPDEAKQEEKPETKEEVPEKAPEAVPDQKTEEENTTEKAENLDSTEKKETTEKEESTEKEASTQDANQNVITLAKEKVLSVEIST